VALFDLCRQYGDPAGSLIFFISTASDRPSSKYYPDYPKENYFRQVLPSPSLCSSYVPPAYGVCLQPVLDLFLAFFPDVTRRHRDGMSIKAMQHLHDDYPACLLIRYQESHRAAHM
jgi:hypothetical protein